MKKLILVTSTLFFVACGDQLKLSTQKFVGKIADVPACEDYQKKVYDELYEQLATSGTLPEAQEFKQGLLNYKIEFAQKHHLTIPQAEQMIEEVINLYRLIKTEGDKTYKNVEDSSPVKRLALLEIEDNSITEGVDLQNKIREQFLKTKSLSKTLDMACNTDFDEPKTPPINELPGETPEIPSENLLLPELKKQLSPTVYSATKLIGIAYQSCEPMKTRAIASEDASVQGIKVTGKHSDGVGSKREISNLSALLNSHFYLQNYSMPSSICHNVKQSPLIYDYGGKPYSLNNELNLFQNAGSGTKALGIDCSAYVFSSLANSGLKLKSVADLRAQHVEAYSSRSFKDPTGSQLDCLEHASFNQESSLKEGDIGAIDGHVFIFGNLGKDPLGIKKITSVSECSPSHIKVKDFDFDIYQSSTSKNGIGIHRGRGADYLETSSNIKTAVLDFAVKACKAQFSSTPVKPTNSYLSIVRHKGTPQCVSKAPIQLTKEACVLDCKL